MMNSAAEIQPTGSELMNFMMKMKDTMEIAMKSVEVNINEKIDNRLTNLDVGMEKLNNVVVENDKKSSEVNKILTGRMLKMEEDIRRLQFRRIQSDTLGKTDKPAGTDGRLSQISKEREVQPVGRTQPEDQPMVRTKSWAEEVEENANTEEIIDIENARKKRGK